MDENCNPSVIIKISGYVTYLWQKETSAGHLIGPKSWRDKQKYQRKAKKRVKGGQMGLLIMLSW